MWQRTALLLWGAWSRTLELNLIKIQLNVKTESFTRTMGSNRLSSYRRSFVHCSGRTGKTLSAPWWQSRSIKLPEKSVPVALRSRARCLIGANCSSLSSFYLAHAISRMTPVQVTWSQVVGGLIDSAGDFNEMFLYLIWKFLIYKNKISLTFSKKMLTVLKIVVLNSQPIQ